MLEEQEKTAYMAEMRGNQRAKPRTTARSSVEVARTRLRVLGAKAFLPTLA
jgi:hypothetical protein